MSDGETWEELWIKRGKAITDLERQLAEAQAAAQLNYTIASQSVIDERDNLRAALADAVASLREGRVVFTGFHHHDETAYDASGKCGCGGMEWWEYAGTTVARIEALQGSTP